jgi:hypothetical protein
MTGVTSGEGTAYPSGALEFTPRFLVGFVLLDLSFVCFVDRCLSFCTFSFGHCVVCSSIYTDSDYPFGIFKLILAYISTFLLLSLGRYLYWWTISP